MLLIGLIEPTSPYFLTLKTARRSRCKTLDFKKKNWQKCFWIAHYQPISSRLSQRDKLSDGRLFWSANCTQRFSMELKLLGLIRLGKQKKSEFSNGRPLKNRLKRLEIVTNKAVNSI